MATSAVLSILIIIHLLTGAFIINWYLYFEKGLVVLVFSESGTFSLFYYFCSFSLTQSVFFQHYFPISTAISLILSNDFLQLNEISVLYNHKKLLRSEVLSVPNPPKRNQTSFYSFFVISSFR